MEEIGKRPMFSSGHIRADDDDDAIYIYIYIYIFSRTKQKILVVEAVTINQGN